MQTHGEFRDSDVLHLMLLALTTLGLCSSWILPHNEASSDLSIVLKSNPGD